LINLVSVPGRNVRDVSLTSQLDDPASALSCFLDRAFPRMDDVSADALTQLPARARAVPDQGNAVPWTTIGTAIDHRLRLAFTPDAVPGASYSEPDRSCNPVAIGIDIAAGNQRHYAALAGTQRHQDGENAHQAALHWERITAFGGALAGRLSQTAARTRPHLNESLALPDPEEADLCRLCYAAAWFDELAHRPAEEHEILNFIGKNGFRNLDEILAVVPRLAIDDMTALVRLAAQSDLADLRTRADPATVTTGPLFPGSADVGGADGDLLVAGILIDIKTTMHLAKHVRAGIRQLLGYVLIDYTSQHAITGIGLYFARQGKLPIWELDELLPRLGAPAPLEALRRQCAKTLRQPEGRSSKPW
jgi:hypothetical protein